MSTTISPTNYHGGASLWELVERAAAMRPADLLAVDELDRRLTFGDYATRAKRVAAGLYAHGVRAGDVVSCMLPTWIETAILCAALDRLGAIQIWIAPSRSSAAHKIAVSIHVGNMQETTSPARTPCAYKPAATRLARVA